MRRALFLATALLIAGQAQAGGRLDDFMRTGEFAAPGFEIDETQGIFWDERCHRVSYTLDSAATATGLMGAIPLMTLAAEVQTSFNQWNNLKTSYIEMHLDRTAAVAGTRKFDFINEVTWNPTAGAGFLASSPSTYFIEDSVVAPGDDIDGDGDSDAFDPDVVGQNVCFDADMDGDIEFPAGEYKAGTILDNDVQFNDISKNPATFLGIRWETTPSSTPAAGTPRLSDIQAVAVHEFGHSHGLAHSLLNQISKTNGTGSTMFPFIDIDDRFAELGQRDLHTDDAAWSSFLYQEGSASSGPAALQAGDIAFKKVYDVVKGTMSQNGVGVLGGNVQATTKGTGETLGEAYSGVALVVEDAGGNLFLFNDVADAAKNGDFSMPVPPGVYNLHIQALDGDPAATTNISNLAIVGGLYGQNAFSEEFRGSPGQETNNEDDPGTPFQTISSTFAPAINIVTNDDIRLRNAGNITNIGASAAIGAVDVKYAERFTRAQVLALLDQKATLTTALFHTFVNDASVVGIYKRALITTGKDNGDGTATINLAKPLQQTTQFVAQDDDLTPYFFDTSNALSKHLEKALKDPTLDVFVVLEADNNQKLADSGIGTLLQLSTTGGGTGKSYLSVAGGPFNVRPNNWGVELRFTPKK